MNDKNFENEEQLFDYLIENGIMNIYGMTEDNELSYALNLQKLKEIMPDFYDLILKDVDDVLLELYKDNLVSIEYDENLNVKYGLTEQAYEILRENGYDIFLKEEGEE